MPIFRGAPDNEHPLAPARKSGDRVSVRQCDHTIDATIRQPPPARGGAGRIDKSAPLVAKLLCLSYNAAERALRGIPDHPANCLDELLP
jgi:hypothetical protein